MVIVLTHRHIQTSEILYTVNRFLKYDPNDRRLGGGEVHNFILVKSSKIWYTEAMLSGSSDMVSLI